MNVLNKNKTLKFNAATPFMLNIFIMQFISRLYTLFLSPSQANIIKSKKHFNKYIKKNNAPLQQNI